MIYRKYQDWEDKIETHARHLLYQTFYNDNLKMFTSANRAA